MNLSLLFQNNHVVVIDKPAGWLTVPGRTADDPRTVLGLHLQKELGQKIYPLHRLDAEVSGLVVFALSSEFHRAASRLFEERDIHKTYQAFTNPGPFPLNSAHRWESLLLRGKKRTYEAPHGKPSITDARVVRTFEQGLEWRLSPQTGRSHQLRYELFKRHCPIWGDSLYGSHITWPAGGIALRAIQLDLPEAFATRWQLPSSLSTDALTIELN